MEADPLRSPTKAGQRVIFLDPQHKVDDYYEAQG